MKRAPDSLSEEDLDAVRRAGRPYLHLLGGLLFLGAGVGLVVLAFAQVSSGHPTDDVSTWLGLVGGVLQIAVGLMALLVWTRQQADYQEFRRIACRRCGYDRRGLATDAKCPECGTLPSN